jgi:hypothetical protein
MIFTDDLAKKMEELLDNNEYGQKFRVFPYVQIIDRNFEKIDGQFTPFVTVMMTNTTGRRRPIKDLVIEDCEFLLEAYFETKKKALVLDCFENLARQIVGKMINVDSDSVTYSIPMSMDIPNIGGIEPQHMDMLRTSNPRLGFMSRSELFSILQVRVYYTYTDSAIFGNGVKLSLKKKTDETYEELSFNNIDFGNPKVVRSEQILNADSTTSVVTTNVTLVRATVYYKVSTITESIVEDMLDGTNQNLVYSLKIEFPTFTKTYDVVIVNPSLPVIMGNTLMLTLEFAKANAILT